MTTELKFTAERFQELIRAMYDGTTPTQWLDKQRELGNPISRTAVNNYKNADSTRKAEYMLAREGCADALAEDVVKISDEGLDPQRTANRMNSRKWLAAKLKPKEYGDKLDIDVKGQIDIQSAVLAGRRRIQTLDNVTFNDATTTDRQSDVALLPSDAIDPFS